MPQWQKKRLGDVSVINELSYVTSEAWKFVNYLDTGNITENKIESIQHIDLSVEKLPSRARRKVRHNSIIYSTVRPNQRHYGIIKKQPDNFLVSTGFAVIDVNCKIADADFMYYLLTKSTVVNRLQAVAEQSTSAYPSVKASDIENLELLLPDLSTQKKIGSLLACIDEKIANNAAINKNLAA